MKTDRLRKRRESLRVTKSTFVTVCFAAAFVVICIFIAVFLILKWRSGGGEENIPEDVVRYDNEGEVIELPEWITEAHIPVNEYSRPGEQTDAINGIVVHYVGNPNTSAMANRNYFAGLADSGATYASSNFIIGLDGEIIEVVPLGEVAYCSNSRNHDTVSIECCHPDESGKFTEATYNSLVKLCRWLTEVYGVERDGVIRHYDVTGKLCPLYFVEHEDEWEILKNDIFGN